MSQTNLCSDNSYPQQLTITVLQCTKIASRSVERIWCKPFESSDQTLTLIVLFFPWTVHVHIKLIQFYQRRSACWVSELREHSCYSFTWPRWTSTYSQTWREWCEVSTAIQQMIFRAIHADLCHNSAWTSMKTFI